MTPTPAALATLVNAALLDVPLTSMLTIALSVFEPTRPFAILMADRVIGSKEDAQ